MSARRVDKMLIACRRPIGAQAPGSAHDLTRDCTGGSRTSHCRS